MKFILGAAFELFLILGMGVASAIRRNPASTEATTEEAAQIAEMATSVGRFFDVYSYAIAGSGIVFGYVVWYFTKGKREVEARPLQEFIPYLLIPLGAFWVVDLIQPTPVLMEALVSLFGQGVMIVAFLMFLVGGTLLHYLCLSPFVRNAPFEGHSKRG